MRSFKCMKQNQYLLLYFSCGRLKCCRFTHILCLLCVCLYLVYVRYERAFVCLYTYLKWSRFIVVMDIAVQCSNACNSNFRTVEEQPTREREKKKSIYCQAATQFWYLFMVEVCEFEHTLKILTGFPYILIASPYSPYASGLTIIIMSPELSQQYILNISCASIANKMNISNE